MGHVSLSKLTPQQLEVERATLIAAAASGALASHESADAVTYSTTDGAGNLIGEFRVIRTDNESWGLDWFQLGLPAQLCDSLTER